MKRSGFKRKIGKPLRRTRIRLVGHSTTAEQKKEIQALARAIVILRDGGCFLRHYAHAISPPYTNCGGYRGDGQLILQAEHLETRANARSFSDTRLIVCICYRHHFYYKPQHSKEYNQLAEDFIGPQNTLLWEAVRNDRTHCKVDLRLEILALKQELRELQRIQLSTGYTS